MFRRYIKIYLGCSNQTTTWVNLKNYAQVKFRERKQKRCGRNAANGETPNVKSRTIPC